jgi:uncharacterized protein (DUF1800 family)
LARKLAAHFITDDPPQAAVDRIAQAYRASDGNLAAVSAALVACPEAWEPPQRKVKSPYEFVLSAARLLPSLLDDEMALNRAFTTLGQRPWAPPSPRGWPDDKGAWLASHPFKARLDWSSVVAERHAPAMNPVELGESALGPLLSDETKRDVARADSKSQGLALLLMSPEFQRR